MASGERMFITVVPPSCKSGDEVNHCPVGFFWSGGMEWSERGKIKDGGAGWERKNRHRLFKERNIMCYKTTII